MAKVEIKMGEIGGGSYTYEERTVSAGATVTLNNINDCLFVVLYDGSSPNYYDCGRVDGSTGTLSILGIQTGFSASYSGNTLTISNTRSSGTYLLEILYA